MGCSVEFSSLSTSRAYSDRDADTSWATWCKREIAPVGKDVIDLGCGGGIYVRGFLACGAHGVIGVDSSKPYIEEAQRPVHKHGLSTRVAWIQDWIANVLTSSLNARSFII